MPEILTTNFKSDSTRLFVEDILTNDYYLMASGIDRLDSENSRYAKNEFLEKVLFGKKIFNDDVHFMIKYYPWQRDEVYTQYDDIIDLEEKNFYAVVSPNNNDTGDYRVFKCLYNNEEAKVQAPPAWNANNATQIYQTADGYLWKFIYSMTALEFDAYNSLGYVPLIGDFDTDPVSNTGGCEVSDIFVENAIANRGYTKKEGSLSQSPYSNGQIFGRPDDDTIAQIFFYYYGQTLYVTNQNNGVSFLFDIEYYNYNTTTGEVEFRVDRDPVLAGVSANARWQILPKIKIEGDGQDAEAVPVLNSDGQITSVTLLDRGTGYNNLLARVVDPLYDFNPNDSTRTDERASLRAVLSPPDGHGTNLIDEFYCRHFGIYAYITGEDNLLIGANNTYSSVGVVKNPEFVYPNNSIIDANNTPSIFDNRIAVTTDDIEYAAINGIVTQVDGANETTFSAKVHDIDYSSNTMFLAEYMGPYQNKANSSNSLDLNLNFRNSTGQIIRINTPIANNVVIPSYSQRSGKMYFLEDFFALPRTENSREEFKFVMEF